MEENMATKASARHILVDSEEQCEELKRQIDGGADFAELAAEHSDCPSGSSGGDLGEFEPGQMVPEFDQVVFNEAVGEVHGPVATQFRYHLIEITDRTE
jgi:peptidyl-prolyl cis-trans isomerase C